MQTHTHTYFNRRKLALLRFGIANETTTTTGTRLQASESEEGGKVQRKKDKDKLAN